MKIESGKDIVKYVEKEHCASYATLAVAYDLIHYHFYDYPYLLIEARKIDSEIADSVELEIPKALEATINSAFGSDSITKIVKY